MIATELSARKYPVDSHTHAYAHYSEPGVKPPRRVNEMVEAAMAVGLSAITLNDHFPLPLGFADPTPDLDCAMPMNDYSTYQAEVTTAQQLYGDRILVLRGAEVDYLPGYKDWTRQELEKYDFDSRTGSVHFLGNNGKNELLLDFDSHGFAQCVDYYRDIRTTVQEYYKRIRAMVDTGMFDIVGHPDLVKKYNDGTLFTGSETWYRSEVTKTLDGIAKSCMAIELNTSGWDKTCKEQYPSEWILREAFARNIPITLSSDAHKPEDVGKNIDRAVVLAKNVGYTSVVRFVKRKKEEVTI